MNILIAGGGKLGETLTKQLSGEGHNITLVDLDSRVLESSLSRYDVMAVEGNCAALDVLKQAGVDRADLLIAATGSDEVNLLCCTTAHWINRDLRTVARIRNPEYADQAYSMQDAFAISMTVNPELQAATEIERLIKYPGFLKRDTFAKGRIEIVELRLDAKSKLCNVTLNSMNSIVKCKVLVCAVLRDGKAVTPGGSFVLREGDRLFVTAPTDTLSLLLKNLGIITKKVRNVMIIGGGRISYYLAEALRKSKIDVQIIEKDAERCRELADRFPDVSVICGDATDQTVLESEGISRTAALVSMTGLDELNMIVSLYAKSCGVPQIITKVRQTENTKVLENLSVGSLICPKLLCCNTIVRFVRAMQNQTGAATAVHSIADGQAEAMEFPVDGTTLHCDVPLKKLKLKKNVLIVGISRGIHTEIPNGESRFLPGDSVVIVSSKDEVISRLNDIFA